MFSNGEVDQPSYLGYFFRLSVKELDKYAAGEE